MTPTIMGRRTFLLGAAAAPMLLAGCSGAGEAQDEGAAMSENVGSDVLGSSDSNQAEVQEADVATASRILVAYYSRADENYAGGGTEWLEVGHTKVMAGYIAEALGADEFEIVPAEAYPEGYQECCDVAAQEQADDARPTIAGELPDVSAYDVVFVGCPIWWGEEPMIVRSFLDAVDLSGKTVIPFTTHGGSGLGSVSQNLQSRVPGATFLDGLAVAGTEVDSARDDVTSWALGLGL